jgi:hypothetical protein
MKTRQGFWSSTAYACASVAVVIPHDQPAALSL